MHGSLSDFPGDKGAQGLFHSLTYPDSVLHVVLSPSTFRYALPSEDVLYLGWLSVFLFRPLRVDYRRGGPIHRFSGVNTPNRRCIRGLHRLLPSLPRHDLIRRSFPIPRSFLASHPSIPSELPYCTTTILLFHIPRLFFGILALHFHLPLILTMTILSFRHSITRDFRTTSLGHPTLIPGQQMAFLSPWIQAN